jgi:hypothetical protein
MYLAGSGIGKAGLDPAGNKGPNEAFGAVDRAFRLHRSTIWVTQHPVSICLICSKSLSVASKAVVMVYFSVFPDDFSRREASLFLLVELPVIDPMSSGTVPFLSQLP